MNQKNRKRDFPLNHDKAIDINLEPSRTVKNKFEWLQIKAREIIENNTISHVRKKSFEKYLRDLNKAVDYLAGYLDYNSICFGSRRIIWFLLSCNKTWWRNRNEPYHLDDWLQVNEDPDGVVKFLHGDLLPEYRQLIIKKFLFCDDTKKPVQDWELAFLKNSKLNDTEVMYQIGRPYAEVKKLRSQGG
ncbi:MAG: hypothetical protein GX452_11810 [Ignavibacteriales bacterium]|nr:hypothetical protein [Ignavibacteriales bacterium]